MNPTSRTARCRVFHRRRGARTGWAWACLDDRCSHTEPRPFQAEASWPAAVTEALAHVRWHATMRRLAA